MDLVNQIWILGVGVTMGSDRVGLGMSHWALSKEILHLLLHHHSTILLFNFTFT